MTARGLRPRRRFSRNELSGKPDAVHIITSEAASIVRHVGPSFVYLSLGAYVTRTRATGGATTVRGR